MSTKPEINKNEFNFINLNGSETLKSQIPGAWLVIWLSHFDIDVVWKPLVNTERLEEMFGKLKEGIIQRFQEKFIVQNQKIVHLEEKIALQEKKIQNLSMKCDDNEQYSRRYCLRMHGLKFDKNESQNDLVSKISECFSEIGLPYEEEEIDWVHR